MGWWIVTVTLWKPQQLNSWKHKGPRPTTSDPIPVCSLQNIAAGPQFRLEGGNEATRARLSGGFLQIATISWNSMWEHWLPDFQWRPVRGDLCGNEEFGKAVARRYSMTHIWNRCSMGWKKLKCLSKARSGAITRAAARPGCLPRRLGPHARSQYLQVWTGGKFRSHSTIKA